MRNTAARRFVRNCVLLVVDLVRQLAFSDFTIALCQLSKYEPEGGIKGNAIQN